MLGFPFPFKSVRSNHIQELPQYDIFLISKWHVSVSSIFFISSFFPVSSYKDCPALVSYISNQYTFISHWLLLYYMSLLQNVGIEGMIFWFRWKITRSLIHTHSLSLSLSRFRFTMQCFFTILTILALLLQSSGLTVIAEDGHGLQDHHPSFPIHRLMQGRCSKPLLFVFGASMVDTGEFTAALPYSSAADFPPYGIDYFSQPAGRWSNRRIITDFISKPPTLAISACHIQSKFPLKIWSHCPFLSFCFQTLSIHRKMLPFPKPQSLCGSAESTCIGIPPCKHNAFVQLPLFFQSSFELCYFLPIIIRD